MFAAITQRRQWGGHIAHYPCMNIMCSLINKTYYFNHYLNTTIIKSVTAKMDERIFSLSITLISIIKNILLHNMQ